MINKDTPTLSARFKMSASSFALLTALTLMSGCATTNPSTDPMGGPPPPDPKQSQFLVNLVLGNKLVEQEIRKLKIEMALDSKRFDNNLIVAVVKHELENPEIEPTMIAMVLDRLAGNEPEYEKSMNAVLKDQEITTEEMEQRKAFYEEFKEKILDGCVRVRKDYYCPNDPFSSYKKDEQSPEQSPAGME